MLIYTVTAQLICSFPFAHAVRFSPGAVNIIPYNNEIKCSSLKCFKVSKLKVYEFGHFSLQLFMQIPLSDLYRQVKWLKSCSIKSYNYIKTNSYLSKEMAYLLYNQLRGQVD